MKSMLPVKGAILFHFQAAGSVFLIFRCSVVAPLALSAGKQNIDAHNLLQDFADNTGAYGAAAFTDGETQTLLHGDGINQLNIKG